MEQISALFVIRKQDITIAGSIGLNFHAAYKGQVPLLSKKLSEKTVFETRFRQRGGPLNTLYLDPNNSSRLEEIQQWFNIKIRNFVF